ncbi:reverse transcriptase domain, Reverse transcriptase zinc-binding domain protein [Artemisia annua]|uniref:Auxin-responsive protein n=1 Tax=Artemisia annua TaxID=35608 RepID=A0A2U1LCC9_ARTAN|nr:reverse transcriptase domain, Reverse transcriptase zinc-binding domain protein [Artemisia annua]
MRRFFWGESNEDEKINWVAWENISRPKKAGGLGISRLKDINEALLLKWSWRLKKENNSLWKRVVRGIHRSKNNWRSLPLASNSSRCWTEIVKMGDRNTSDGRKYNSLFYGIVGDGKTLRFWIDLWIGDEPLKDAFPILFRLEKCKDVLIMKRVNLSGEVKNLKWDWRRAPTTQQEVSELFGILNLIYDYSWDSGSHSWKWLGDDQGCFTVASAKRLISSSRNYGEFFKMKWNGWIPLKCNVMAWRAEQDRLPTRMELTKRGMVLQDSLCPLCADNPETSGHLFTACLFATEVWARIASWCKLAPIFAFEVRDLIILPKHLKMRKQESRTFHGIVLTTLWLEQPITAAMDVVGSLNFNDTELTLGLPGETRKLVSKRRFSDMVDLKLGRTDQLDTECSVVTKSPPSKERVVGWPPVNSYRKNVTKSSCKYIKVAVDGAPYLRKVDLEMYTSYQQLLCAFEDLFSCFTIRNVLNEKKLVDLVNGIEYVPT